MASTIKLKNGSGAPTAGDLVQGEPALDLTNKRLYTEDSGGTVIEVGVNPTSVTTGTFTSTGIDDNATSTAITIDSSENVGIGTTSPQYVTEIAKSQAGGVGPTLYLHNTADNVATGHAAEIRFNLRGAEATTRNAAIQAVAEGTYGTSPALTFLTSSGDNGSATERMRIDSSGNVGIGTSSPSEELHLSKSASGADVCARIQNSAVSSGDTATLRFSVTSNSSFDSAFVGSDRNNALILGSNAAERMRIDSSGNVGIGRSSPTQKLSLYKSIGYNTDSALFSDFAINDDAVNNNAVHAWRTGITGNAAGHSLTFSTLARTQSAYQERMRIDSSGNLLVGTTDSNVYNDATGTGTVIQSNGIMQLAANNGTPLYANRQGNDGDIIDFRKDGTTVGSIGVLSSHPYFVSTSRGIRVTNGEVLPCTSSGVTSDNTMDLGSTFGRYDDIYATNGTIQTSDRNEKQDIAELSDAEQRVAVACKGLLRKFRWKDAVAEKGDDARIHFGIIAQDLQSAFEAEGLDAGDYAMFISSTWYEKEITVDAVEAVYEDAVVTPAQEAGFREVSPEVQAEPAYYDVDGNEIKAAVEYQAAVHEATEAVEEVTEQRLVSEAKEAYTYTDTSEEPKEGYTERTRMGVRYPELLSFIIAAI